MVEKVSRRIGVETLRDHFEQYGPVVTAVHPRKWRRLGLAAVLFEWGVIRVPSRLGPPGRSWRVRPASPPEERAARKAAGAALAKRPKQPWGVPWKVVRRRRFSVAELRLLASLREPAAIPLDPQPCRPRMCPKLEDGSTPQTLLDVSREKARRRRRSTSLSWSLRRGELSPNLVNFKELIPLVRP